MMKRVTSFLLAIVILAGFVLTAAPKANAASAMTASDSMIAVLKQEEGFSRTPYWDYAQYTVGYGTACPADMVDYYMENGITEEAAEILLRNYLANTENTINKKFIDKYGLTLTQGQFDALVSFTYNCGAGWISETNGTFHNAVKNGATGSELIRAFSLWCSAGGKILPGLVRRRLSEANMFLNGQYSRTAPENYCYVYFNPNGGSVSYKIQGYDANLGTAPAYTPTKSGSTFLGWYTAQVGGVQVTTLTQAMSGSTLYARWEEPQTDTPAVTPDQSVLVTVTGTNVNLRKGPGTNYGIVGTVTAGDQLQISETAYCSTYHWGNAGGKWVCLQYTNYDAVIAAMQQTTATTAPETTEPETTEAPSTEATETTEAPTTETTEAPTTETTEAPTTETTAPPITEPPATTAPGPVVLLAGNVRANGGLSIRSGPGTGYARIGTLRNGTRVNIYDYVWQGNGYWGKTEAGWISLNYVYLDYVAPTDPNATEPPATEAPATEPPATEPPATEPAATEPPATTTAVGGTVRANGGLAVRHGAGTSYALSRYLPNGSRVTISQTAAVNGVNWGFIGDGWICLSYVVLDTPAANTAVTKVVVADCLRIRSAAGTGNTVVGFAYYGAYLNIYETATMNGSAWGRCDKGWVSMDYLR